jgi:NAD(P)-dependent dehydrogenase (short-subunit alcohol dehydrogenase family)
MMLSAWKFMARLLAHWITQSEPSLATNNIFRSEPHQSRSHGKAGRQGGNPDRRSTGLGRAYAKGLVGLGAKVAAADLNLRSYEEFEAEAKDMTADSTVAEIEAAGGIALGIEVDVRDHESVQAMEARVVQEWGRVDVLVANAGGGRGRPMATKASTLDPTLLQLVTEMNLFGTVIPATPSHRS